MSSRRVWTARDREAPGGEQVRILRLEVSGGCTEDGYRLDFSCLATKMWVTQ
ncbi:MULTISPECIES: hypothetical protein [unclassified Streptomyces]|uniref:hypothetical protein n=1 Tax=unclassified Streptomyces TaxID=2593676 RepID=UPI0036823768